MDEMDIETAAKMLAGAPPISALPDIRNNLAEIHSDHPQRHMLAASALDEIEDALARLAALGHRFFLTQADPTAPEGWPKMVYRERGDGVLETATADGQSELDALAAAGWRDHPAQPELPLAGPPKGAAGTAAAKKDSA
jgi:hypothetical protein